MKRLQSFLREQNLDGALFKNLGEREDPTIRYFTGYDGTGVLYVPAKGKPTLYVPKLEATRARQIFKHTELIDRPLKKLLPLNQKLGVELDTWLVSEWRKLRIKGTDIRDFTRGLRMVKSKRELSLMRKAAHHTSQIFTELLDHWSTFTTESDVAAWIEYEVKKRGGTPAFPTIVASGKHAAMPHYIPKNRKLLKGFCVMDFGMRYKGYCADMTRTIFLGKPSHKQRQWYECVRAAHTAAYDAVRPGVKTSLVHAAAQRSLGAYAKYFIHAVGHGLGLEVHEAPSVGPKGKDMLRVGMTITVEPGVYLPNQLGIRLEDDVVVTGDGADLLTTAERNLIVMQQ